MSQASTPRPRGRFLTFEGVDGAGKSTHVDWLCTTLRGLGKTVVSTREPGGTVLGEQLRNLLLHQSMALETEVLLMFAARSEHQRQVIEPALARGDWVVSDRYTDASFAYQGGGRQLGCGRVAALEDWLRPAPEPDRTWLFDIPLEVARERLGAARAPDRFEAEDQAFFERTRQAYLERAAASEGRIHVVDARLSINAIRVGLRRELEELIDG